MQYLTSFRIIRHWFYLLVSKCAFEMSSHWHWDPGSMVKNGWVVWEILGLSPVSLDHIYRNLGWTLMRARFQFIHLLFRLKCQQILEGRRTRCGADHIWLRRRFKSIAGCCIMLGLNTTRWQNRWKGRGYSTRNWQGWRCLAWSKYEGLNWLNRKYRFIIKLILLYRSEIR